MYTALRATSLTLRSFLQTEVAASLPNGGDVFLQTPEQMAGDEGVSVWLYRVARDESLANIAPERIGARGLRRTPLPLRLHYLVTPILNAGAGAIETEQVLLGRILQAFYDAPLLRGQWLQGEFRDTAVELNVRLETLSVDEISRLWQALTAPMRLSLSYEVSVVSIASALEDETRTPVVIVEPELGVIAGAG